jgi:membrane carboxypeptidase/penicillin-binding protein PbpC
MQEVIQELRSTVDESIQAALRQQAASAHADQIRMRNDHEASMIAVLQRADEVVKERDEKVPFSPEA